MPAISTVGPDSFAETRIESRSPEKMSRVSEGGQQAKEIAAGGVRKRFP